MIKKIILSSLFIALCAFLLYGAIHRTTAKTEADGGRESAETRERAAETDAAGAGQNAQTASSADGEIAWRTFPAMVISVSETEMVLHDALGEEVLVEGRPWSYAVEQGFTAQPGDVVDLTGYDDVNEFKVGTVENHTSGQKLIIRDSDGNPMWRGQGGGQ